MGQLALVDRREPLGQSGIVYQNIDLAPGAVQLIQVFGNLFRIPDVETTR